MMNKRVTIYDVAKAMGFSASYISKALNDNPIVSDAVKERVKRKAEEMHYMHNTYAANLRRGHSRTIGVIVPHINNSFFSDVISGIENACSARKYGLIICQSLDSEEKEQRAIDTLLHLNVESIIISVAKGTFRSDHLQPVIDNGVRLIEVDRYLKGFDCIRVINDNYGMGRAAVAHLLSCGYRRIAFMGTSATLDIYKQRKAGFLDALHEAGIEIHEEDIYDDLQTPEKANESVMQMLLKKDRPDAIFSTSDMLSFTVLQTAHSLGVNIPQELGVISTGNETITSLAQPSITAIDQHGVLMGNIAAGKYFELLDNKDSVETEQTVPFSIIKRESTR